MRDKVIGKKWIYSDTERSIPHRAWGITEVSMAVKCGMVSFYRLGKFIC